jgi:hypothetical protein
MVDTVKSYARSERGQRISQPDFEHVAEREHVDAAAQTGSKLLIGPDSTVRSFILSGFDTSDTGLTITVNGGTAFLNYRDRDGIKEGLFTSGGDASKTLDLTNFADDTYKVYVRFDLLDGSINNRIFWNAAGAPPVETPRAVATRRTEGWSVVVEITSPGGEWTEIAQVVKAAGSLTVTDLREFFFEGRDDNNFLVVDAEWGAAADRNVTRAINGVFGFRRAIRALQRQFQDLFGTGEGWWKTIAASGAVQNLTRYLTLDGAREMEGDLIPNTAGRGLGQSAKAWLLSATKVRLAANVNGGDNLVEFEEGTGFSTEVQMNTGAPANQQGSLLHNPTGGPGGLGQTTLSSGGGAGRVVASAAEIDLVASVDAGLLAPTGFLSNICEGQKGLAFVDIDMSLLATLPVADDVVVSQTVVIAPSSGALEATDYIIGAYPDSTLRDLLNQYGVDIASVSITGTNNVKITFHCPNSLNPQRELSITMYGKAGDHVLSAVTGVAQTLTDNVAGFFQAYHIGWYIRIRNETTSANNGVFQITDAPVGGAVCTGNEYIASRKSAARLHAEDLKEAVMEVKFLDIIMRYENLLAMGGCWSALKIGTKMLGSIADAAWFARIQPGLAVLLCIGAMWLPGLQPSEAGFGERLMLGFILGAVTAFGHKAIKQSILGHDKRINGKHEELKK